MAKNVRRRLLVKKELQFKLAAIQVFSMLLVAATCLVTYKILIDFVTLNLKHGQELENFIRGLSQTLTGQLIVLLVIGASVSFLVSNRILGPVYRLEKDIDIILSDVEQRISKRIKVRKGDEILSLVDAVNKLLDSFEDIYEKNRNLKLTVKNRIDGAKDKFGASKEVMDFISDLEKSIED
ncbi:MAG: hypothetical protein COT16_03205 [Elusimicrobia bacterium CG08_land_8_20_14_0_20_44_26]|nr:MAG: hypothetical protein COT16_03205 [Elusimicrobia bacterium CG08_land_8_20_14_0_20_44_26]